MGRYQQHVVAEHLKKGTFNTRLAAVNWLDGIIYRAFRTENESGIQVCVPAIEALLIGDNSSSSKLLVIYAL